MPTIGKHRLNCLMFDQWTFLDGIDVGDDVTDFVQWKIKSLCARIDDDEIEGREKQNFFA